MLTAVAVGFAALTALSTGRGAFLDIALGVSLINFVATAAFAVFLERKRKGS
jgi:multicomponent Na+:H+ antiporter subunit F